MSESFQNEIQEAAQKDDDIQLAKSIYDYLLSIWGRDTISWKKLKYILIAAKTSLNEKEAEAVDNVFAWTELNPNTIAVILRTYEHATPELKQAQQDGRIGRYLAETISRLKGSLKELQPRVVEIYLRYGLTNNELKVLIQDLRRTINQHGQKEILAKYAPIVPATSLDIQPGKQAVYLFTEMRLSDLDSLSDDELWKLKGVTEESLQKAIPALTNSLEHIKQEVKKRL